MDLRRPRATNCYDQIFAARGEDIELYIDGVPLGDARIGERLSATTESILPEAACTSVQLHLRVAPEDFADHWNAAQAIAGIQVAIAGNSPFFAGKALWHETRIPVFAQATDTRPLELKNQGVRPRVWFGERWITTHLRPLRGEHPLLPRTAPRLRRRGSPGGPRRRTVPALSELNLHNGDRLPLEPADLETSSTAPAHVRIENASCPPAPA